MISRTNKLAYYALNFLRQIIPGSIYVKMLNGKLKNLDRFDRNLLAERVNYYNKLNAIQTLEPETPTLKDLKRSKKLKTYRFDAYETARFFPESLKAHFLFGDVVHTPPSPTFVKSRPVHGTSPNSVLLKLNKVRHFIFVDDRMSFQQKKNMLIGRATVTQPHRMQFYEKYFNHPLCNLGQVNKEGGNAEWIKPKITRAAHLDYKFILCLEGNDVATNLKWVMSSQSIAVMPKPKYETWFMEGKLIPGTHFIEIRDDFSDLEEKMQYYIDHEEESLTIVKNANRFVQTFRNDDMEEMISLLVMQKYFYYTGQVKSFEL
ncbi:MAG: glycosyltransferase [Flavisolibacter sp.]